MIVFIGAMCKCLSSA